MNPIFLSALKNVDELEKDFNHLVNENKSISKECQRLKQELELQNEQSLELRKIKENEISLLNRVTNYQLEISTLHSEIAKLETDLKGKETKLEELEIEKDIAFQELREEISNLEVKIEDGKVKEQTYLEEQNRINSTLKRTYEEKITNLEKEVQSSKNKEYDTSSKFSKIKDAYEELMRSYTDINDQQKGIERQFREQMANKVRQMEEDRRKKESDMKSLLESQKKMILMEVRGQFDDKIKKLEEVIKAYRQKDLQNSAKLSSVPTKPPESKKQLRVSFNDSLNETSYFKSFSDDELSQLDDVQVIENNSNENNLNLTSNQRNESLFKTKTPQQGIPTMDALDDVFDSFSVKSNIFKDVKTSNNNVSSPEIFDLDYFSEKSKRPHSTPKASNSVKKGKQSNAIENSAQKKSRLF